MTKIFFDLYELICSLLGFLLLFAINRKNVLAKPCSVKYGFYVFAFVLYIILILHITGAGTLSEWFVYPFMFSEQQINLIPFVSDMINPLVTPQSLIDLVFLIVNSILESFLNTALFIPLGVFLCILWGVHNGYLAARIGFFFSLIIELSQLLNARVTDVDDLFFNTLGTVLGLVILKHVMKQNLQISKIVLFEGKDPSIWIIAIFLGRFFLFDEIGLAKILNLV